MNYETAEKFGLNKTEAAKFYKALKRNPSIEELAVCGALWSEHCSYKSSKVHLKRFHTKEPWVLQGPGENAGVVQINNEWAIAFKMESHNHPSFIEPYQGAATGVGGILRDIFCMGALPIANLNCLRFGENEHNGILLRDSVRGIGDYGNSVGIPTVTGDVSFHAGYNKNILVNAFCAGLIHKDKIYRGIVQSGSVLVYFGSPTGRDGVHGATMSSKEFKDGESLRPTIQVGDPFMEKVLLEATLALIRKKLVIGLQDMGAAGLTSSSVEMAGRSGCGVQINLDDIPKRTNNLKAFEILLSESQERMLCAVMPEQLDAVFEELQKYSLSYAVIGSVNETGLFECFYEKEKVVSLPVHILVDNAPYYSHKLETKENYRKLKSKIKNSTTPSKSSLEIHTKILNGISVGDLLEKYSASLEYIFSHPQFGDRFPVYSHYCSTVKGLTVAASGALRTAAAGVVMLPEYAQDNFQENQENQSPQMGLSVAGGCEERFCDLDPYLGSILSVLKIGRKIIATGGTPLAMTDCLNFGSPKNPIVMRQISDAVDGINLVAKAFHIPIVSGNVSLNNQTEGEPIAPTPMIGMVGRINDVLKVPRSHIQKNRNPTVKWQHDITLIQLAPHNAFTSSTYNASNVAWILGGENRDCPSVHLELEHKLWNSVLESIQQFSPQLCVPIGHGGLLGSLISLSLKSNLNLKLNDSILNLKSSCAFAEGNMGFIFGFEDTGLAQKFISTFSQNSDFLIQDVGVMIDPVVKRDDKVKLWHAKSMNEDILSHIRPLYLNSLQKYFDTLWK